MAIPILPLPAGGTGLQALMGGFQQGIQNAGQIQKNRLNQLLTTAQATKNKYLASSLIAANQLANERAQNLGIQNQYLPGQLSGQNTGIALKNQLLQGQVTSQPAMIAAQLANTNSETGLNNTKSSIAANPSIPQSNVIKSVIDAIHTHGFNSPQAQGALAYYAKSVAPSGSAITNNISPQVGQNGVMPSSNGIGAGSNPAAGFVAALQGQSASPSNGASQASSGGGLPMSANGQSQMAPALTPNSQTTQAPMLSGMSLGAPIQRRGTAGSTFYSTDPTNGQINYASVPTIQSVTALQKASTSDQNALSNLTSIYSGEEGEVGGLPGMLKQGAQSLGELMNVDSPGLNKLAVATSNVTPAAAGFLGALGVHPSVAAMDETKANILPDNSKTLAYNRGKLANYTVQVAARQFQNKEYLKYGYSLQNQPPLNTNELQSYVDTQLRKGVPMNQLASNLYNYMALQIPKSFPSQAAKMQWYNSQPANVKPLIAYKVLYNEQQASKAKK